MNDNRFATHWRHAAPLPSGFIGKSRAFFRDAILSVFCAANRSLGDKFIRCLYCHYVFDDQKVIFEHLILKLKETGQFIDTDTCIQMLQGEKKIDRRYYHLSFDDGFRNNFTNAFPILRKYGIPAIFFVPSSLIEANWEKNKKYCLETTQYNSVIEMLRWNDLKKMIAMGYEIGSHTKTHARFSEISHDAFWMENEIFGSKKEIETNLGCECKYISWPYGRLTDVDHESLKMVKNADYHACFGAYRGTIVHGKTDIFSIPRHHFEVQWPISHVEYFARGNMEVTT